MVRYHFHPEQGDMIQISLAPVSIAEKTYRHLASVPLQKPSRALLGPSQKPLKVLGQFEMTIDHKLFS